MAAGVEACSHRVEVDPVAGRVDENVARRRARPQPARSRGRRPRRRSPCRRRAPPPPRRRARRRGRAAEASSTSADSARSRTIAGAIVPPAPRTATLIAQLPRSQGEPELDAVGGAREVAAGQLLHLPDPVAERVPVAVELARGALPVPVLLDERLERAQQLVAVVALGVLDRVEDAVAVEREARRRPGARAGA